MPKFNRQNKKKINPRYFLEETTNRDQVEEAFGSFATPDRAKKVAQSGMANYRAIAAAGEEAEKADLSSVCTAGKHCEGIMDWVERMGATGYYEGGKKMAVITDKAAAIKEYSDAIAPPDGVESWDSYFGTSPFSVKGYSDIELKRPGSPLDKLLVVLIRRGVRKAQKLDPNRGSWNDDDPRSKVGTFVKLSKSDYELYLFLRNFMGHTPNMNKFGKANNPGWDIPGEER